MLDRQGRLYLGGHEPGVLVRWTPSGEYDGSMGRLGEGPGELGRIRMIQMGPEGDTVHVIHGVGVIDRSGDITSFLQASPPDQEVWARGVGLALAGTDGDFWVGPLKIRDDAYVLERWALSGEMVDQIERQIDWIPEGVVGGEEMGLGMLVRRHSDGMLHVLARVPHPDADQGAFAAIPGVVRGYGRFEILDPGNRTVMASAWLGQHPESVGSMSGGLSGSDLNFRISPDSDGVPQLIMQRLVLDGC